MVGDVGVTVKRRRKQEEVNGWCISNGWPLTFRGEARRGCRCSEVKLRRFGHGWTSTAIEPVSGESFFWERKTVGEVENWVFRAEEESQKEAAAAYEEAPVIVPELQQLGCGVAAGGLECGDGSGSLGVLGCFDCPEFESERMGGRWLCTGGWLVGGCMQMGGV